MDKKLADSEIKKALECCSMQSYPACCECPYHDRYSNRGCIDKRNTDIAALINRQKAEIERLNSRKEVVVPSMRSIDGNPLYGFTVERNLFVARTVEDVKAEAYKEFVKNAKEELYDWVGAGNSIEYSRITRVFDNLLKEMVGENDANEKAKE